jgi:hypothetical protein
VTWRQQISAGLLAFHRQRGPEVYRSRAKGLERRMKMATRTDKTVMSKKKKALNDMANNEDWLDGKPSAKH